jgi:hypothetical protein
MCDWHAFMPGWIFPSSPDYNKPIKCLLLLKLIIWSVRFRSLMTFNRRGITVGRDISMKPLQLRKVEAAWFMKVKKRWYCSSEPEIVACSCPGLRHHPLACQFTGTNQSDHSLPPPSYSNIHAPPRPVLRSTLKKFVSLDSILLLSLYRNCNTITHRVSCLLAHLPSVRVPSRQTNE